MTSGRRSGRYGGGSRAQQTRQAPRQPAAQRPAAHPYDADQICANASPDAVRSAYDRLGPWGDPQDPLCIEDPSDVAAQLAGWQVSHLLEAWRYFSGSLNALLNNSPSNSIHLAYYAQLRSAMSLFAGSGISVKQGGCFYVDGAGMRVGYRGEQTHKIVWAMWEAWSRKDFAKELIGEKIKFASNLSLSMITAAPNSNMLLDSLGYDLLMGSQDHVARNNASYDPKADVATPIMTPDSVDFVRSMWSLLQGTQTNLSFDVALARFFVDEWASQLAAAPATVGSASTARDVIDNIIAGLLLQGDVNQLQLEAIFHGDVDTSLFTLAAKADVGARNVMARALFLLRIATLAVANSLDRQGAGNSTACKEWIKNWLSQVGVVIPSEEVELVDIGEDYAKSMQIIDDADAEILPSALWSDRLAPHSARLTRAEGFCAWALPLA